MTQMQGTRSYYPGYETEPFTEEINRFVGGHFEYHDAHQVDFILDGEDGKIHVIVGDEDGNQQKIMFSESKEVDLAVAGPYGLHNSYAEAASTCYVIYAAWNSYTNPEESLDYLVTDDTAFEGCIFAVPSGTVVNAAVIAALTGNFDAYSKPLGFFTNDDQSDILGFYSVDRKTIRYHATDFGIVALNNGVEEAETAISLVGIVPEEACRIRLYVAADQTDDDPVSNVLISIFDGTTVYDVLQSGTLGAGAIGEVTWLRDIFDIDVINAVATLLYYIWSDTPTGGLDVYVQAVQLFE